jgi:flagellar biosynthesis/type III secretory pathway M-ring protein FliF/YscJ
MNDFINFLILLILAMLLLLAIIFIAGVIYWIIWTAIYIPINKKFKYDERLAEKNKEYNKLEVEHANLIKFTEEQKKVFDEYSIRKQNVLEDMRKAEDELKRKQRLIKESDEQFKKFNAFLESPEGKKWLKSYKPEENNSK